ncbi:hypothetical protein ABZX72_11930 [Streptomyces cyaneofuscatus]|uniref:dTMP kinase n=1 Tax=Streptomyces cyaneofuscatus TaxID=66883 RepID=UPI0033B3B801
MLTTPPAFRARPTPQARPVSFRPPIGPGRLIAFEGVDGAGKSTSLALAAEILEAAGVPFEQVDLLSPECRRLPYFRRHADDPVATSAGPGDQPSLGIVCLADRLTNLRTRYHEVLHRGTWLLVDRYVYTPLAEGVALGSDPGDLRALTALAGMFPRPDAAFFPLAPVDLVIERIRSRPKDRHKVLDPTFYRNALDAFAAYSEHGWTALDSTRGTDAAREELRDVLGPLLPTARA